MSKALDVKIHVKFATNKEKTMVLFAEAGSDFIDVLLSFLVLPLGTIVKVLEKHYGDEAPLIGSLKTLYRGVANLDIIHFKDASYKQNLLIPPSCCESRLRKLRLNISCTQPTGSASGESYDGVFTKSAASFIISNDLRVLPNVAGSIMKTLSTLGIAVADMDGAETRNMTFGLNKIMALLKETLISWNPLTALVFPKRRILAKQVYFYLHQMDQMRKLWLHKSTIKMTLTGEWHDFFRQIDPNVSSMNPKKMVLKVMLLKSTNKLLFAQAGYDFVNFLFSLLTVSLGKVEWFLGSNTGLRNLDNLHRSIADTDYNKMHLKSSNIKDLLIKSTWSTHYHLRSTNCNELSHLDQCHVKGERMYMVSDDLTVAPLGVTSCLSILNGLNISLSDVEEVELQIGLQEGLNILKAALTSTTALTDALIKHIKPITTESVASNSAQRYGLINHQSSKKRPKTEVGP